MPSLRETLTTRFDVPELHVLLDELGLAYDDLPGDGKPARVVATLRALRRRQEIPRLIDVGRRLRPDIDWDAVQDTPPLDADLGGPPPCYVNIPHRPAHFVGRATELAELRSRLLGGQSRAAITALDGKPGVGKTTLAVELAWDAAVLAHFWGGVLWAGLGPTATPDASLGLWAAALGVSLDAAPTTDTRAALVQAGLRGRPFLLVLDDVWGTEQVYPLLQVAGPGCAHVLTTRDEGLAREFAADRQRVAELNEDEAVDLLARHCPLAAQVAPDALRRLARGVGGLPLALDLVGGYLRARVRFPEQAASVLDGLQQAAAWLDLRSARRRLSLDEVIGLSVDALTDDARRAFLMLAGFAPKPAGFDRAAALAVTVAGLDALAELLDHNLLEEAASGELALHQTLAEAARRRAGQAGVLRAAEVRHAEYYAEIVAGYDDALDEGRMTYAAPLAWDQVAFALDRLTEGAPGDDSLAHLLVRYARDWRNTVTNNYDARRTGWLAAAVAAVERLGDAWDQATTLQAQGDVYRFQDHYDEALAVYGRALALYEQVGDRLGQANTLRAQGDVLAFRKQNDEALAVYGRALALYKQVGDRLGQANTLRAQGDVLAFRQQNDEALAVYGRALALYKQVGSRLGQANTLKAQGDVYRFQDHYDEALAVYGRALALYEQVGDRLGQANTLRAQGDVLAFRKQNDEALAVYGRALALYKQVGDRLGQANTLRAQGDVLAFRQQNDEALAVYGRALALYEQVGSRMGQANSYTSLAQIAQAARDFETAWTQFNQAQSLYQAIGDRYGQGRLLLFMGDCRRDEGQVEAARSLYNEAAGVWHSLGLDDMVERYVKPRLTALHAG